mmetsp:Transcript_621/g.1295  ORF Transcript_621/g.1295 Transcript_621/m.1295 type:complete len:206 (+) Transcript_621:15-632(+)
MLVLDLFPNYGSIRLRYDLGAGHSSFFSGHGAALHTFFNDANVAFFGTVVVECTERKLKGVPSGPLGLGGAAGCASLVPLRRRRQKRRICIAKRSQQAGSDELQIVRDGSADAIVLCDPDVLEGILGRDSLLGVVVEHGADNGLGFLRNVVPVSLGEFHNVVAKDGRKSTQQNVQGCAQRKDIRSRADAVSVTALRRSIDGIPKQ